MRLSGILWLMYKYLLYIGFLYGWVDVVVRIENFNDMFCKLQSFWHAFDALWTECGLVSCALIDLNAPVWIADVITGYALMSGVRCQYKNKICLKLPFDLSWRRPVAVRNVGDINKLWNLSVWPSVPFFVAYCQLDFGVHLLKPSSWFYNINKYNYFNFLHNIVTKVALLWRRR